MADVGQMGGQKAGACFRRRHGGRDHRTGGSHPGNLGSRFIQHLRWRQEAYPDRSRVAFGPGWTLAKKAPPRGWARGGAATDDGFEGEGPVAVAISDAGALPANCVYVSAAGRVGELACDRIELGL